MGANPRTGLWEGSTPSYSLAGKSDEQLARVAASGDVDAFRLIYERHHEGLYRYCYAILRDPQDAADALQATMASAIGALPNYVEGLRHLRPWLYRIAHNDAVSLLRRRQPTAHLDDAAPAGTDVHDQAVAREGMRDLFADLADLPERQRSAIVMRELCGLDYGEVATAIGATTVASRRLVHEARRSLGAAADGRSLSCLAVQDLLGDGDRRRLRGRRLRAHLARCESCKAVARGDTVRRALGLTVPPLSAPAAETILRAAIGPAAPVLPVGGAAVVGFGTTGGLLGPLIAGAASGLAIVVIGAGLAPISPWGGQDRRTNPEDQTQSALAADPNGVEMRNGRLSNRPGKSQGTSSADGPRTPSSNHPDRAGSDSGRAIGSTEQEELESAPAPGKAAPPSAAGDPGAGVGQPAPTSNSGSGRPGPAGTEITAPSPSVGVPVASTPDPPDARVPRSDLPAGPTPPRRSELPDRPATPERPDLPDRPATPERRELPARPDAAKVPDAVRDQQPSKPQLGDGRIRDRAPDVGRLP